MPYKVGVDIGGTFTDGVAISPEGVIYLAKALSTPDDFSLGVVKCLQLLAESLRISLNDFLGNVDILIHGCTIVENSLINREIAKAGLITTRGFEDTLIMSRGGYGRCAGLSEEEIKHPVFTEKPPPLIPRSFTRGIKERVDYKGRILKKPEPREVREVLYEFQTKGVRSVAVCFLWSFMNSENELQVEKVIRENYPNLPVTLSSRLIPILGEYERMSTVAINAVCLPTVSKYVSELTSKLQENSFRGNLFFMQGYGGVVRTFEALSNAVGLIESGPAGGIIGSQFLARATQNQNVIACDMGGTSFKVSIITDGSFEYAKEPIALRYHYLVPKIDIISIGAGGGSILSLEPSTGSPMVGPKSAGAYPGPVCYDLGGVDPTVTDADLILGYIEPDFFAGGQIKLDKAKAIKIFDDKLAKPLGLDVVSVASNFYQLTNAVMADLIRKMTIERGLDPRDYCIFAYGGAGPLHLGAIAGELRIPQVVLPSTASVHSAFGLATSNVVREFRLTRKLEAPADEQEVNRIFDQIQTQALTELKEYGFKEESVILLKTLAMKFKYQVHQILVPLASNKRHLGRQDLDDAYERFEILYEQKHGKGSAYREAGMEIIGFYLRAIGKFLEPILRKYEETGIDSADALIDTKPVHFTGQGMIETKIYNYDLLKPAHQIEGPAVILGSLTSVVINPRHRVNVDKYKNVVMHVDG